MRKFKIVYNGRPVDLEASDYDVNKDGLHLYRIYNNKKYRFATFPKYEYIIESGVFN
jgi:hypothetical protein